VTRLTLRWFLRQEMGNGHRGLAKDALNADDPVAYLNQVRNEAWRHFEDRHKAARWLTDHLWPDDAGHQRPMWHAEYLNDIREIEAQKRMGQYEPPKDDDGRVLDGYHGGGIWFHEVSSAEPLTCPGEGCNHQHEFWDYEPVEEGDAIEPALRCPVCKAEV